MINHWRPDDWKNPYQQQPKNLSARAPITVGKLTWEHTAYEKGADALIEALFKLAKESPHWDLCH